MSVPCIFPELDELTDYDSEFPNSVKLGIGTESETRSVVSTTKSSVEERALILLGQGISSEVVANACGVSPSRISQLLSNSLFAEKVSLLRYENLQKHNLRDSNYDLIEDKLVDKLNRSIPMMFRPIEILKAIQVINGAKRRGQSAPESIVNQQTIVNLTLPAQITQKFTTNVNNQVISVGSVGKEENLLTMQAGTLLKRAEAKKSEFKKPNDSNEKDADRSNLTAITVADST